MDTTELNTEVRGREGVASAIKQHSISFSDIINYVEPEIATILDKAGAKVYILRAELFSNVENFLRHLNIGNGDEVFIVTSVHDPSVLPAIKRVLMIKGATVRTFISYKLPASTFILGIVKGLSF